MAMSAFKSTSKRGSLSTNITSSSLSTQSTKKGNEDSATKKVPQRRSRSVSAFSRGNHLDVDLDFVNRRDNPLFWEPISPVSDGESAVKLSKFGEGSEKSSRRLKGLSDGDGGEDKRGRPVTRNPGVGSGFRGGGGGSRKDAGRSLSRVDTGRRRRSVSRGHYESYLHIPNWDERSTAYNSEAEEKTIQPVTEYDKGRHLRGGDVAAISGKAGIVRTEVKRVISDIQDDFENVIQRSNAPEVVNINIADIPTNLINTDAVELVTDIRGEYAKKLEESQQRARRLRAELAAEEHREDELTEILKEIIPDPKTPNAQKLRVRRKGSMERRKMSKRLEEEALAYFDECVSISTLDGSDFSSLEDPPSHIVRTIDPDNEVVNLLEGSSGIPTVCHPAMNQDSPSPNLLPQMSGSYGFLLNNSTNESLDSSSSLKIHSGLKKQFSFGHRPINTSTLEQEIRNYTRSLVKYDQSESQSSEPEKSDNLDGDICSQIPVEQFLFDRVTLKNRIESGGLLLCGGGIGYPVATFASIIR